MITGSGDSVGGGGGIGARSGDVGGSGDPAVWPEAARFLGIADVARCQLSQLCLPPGQITPPRYHNSNIYTAGLDLQFLFIVHTSMPGIAQ